MFVPIRKVLSIIVLLEKVTYLGSAATVSLYHICLHHELQLTLFLRFAPLLC